MSTRTIEAYADGSPFAFVVPPAQRDPVAAAKLLSLIQAGGAEVHRAGASFTADAETFDAGTHVVLLAQPFGRWVKDLLEPQHYPEIRWPDPATPVDRPYDATAWTLGMFLGVETIQIDHPFDAPLILEREPIEADDGAVNGHGNIFVLRHESSNVFTAMNRLLRLGAEVAWAREPVDVNGHRRPTGSVIVTDIDRERMDAMAQELKLSVDAIPTPPPVPTLRIPAPRIALFEPWGGNIDAGWTRWVLEQYEFPYTHVRNAALRTDSLRDRFDVIIVPEMSTAAIVRGLRARNVPPQYRGGIGRVGIRNLRTFLEDGGTVVTLGSSADFAIDSLEVPLENTVRGLDSDTFFGPGSILRIEVDTEHPIGYGMPREADAMFVRNGVYRPTGAATTDSITPVASYPARDLLRSGWIIGESRLHGAGAILEATVGRGRVILHTFRVQNRAQTLGTFKLLFNSLFYGPAVAGAPATATVDQDLGRP